jgi:hypothetical protein
MADENEPYRLYDNKSRAFVNQKEYASESTANKAAERRNLEFGSSRYSAEKYSDVVRRNTPKPSSMTGGGGRAGNLNIDGGMGVGSPSLDNPIKQAKGGMASSRADGVAQRGKTKGRIC